MQFILIQSPAGGGDSPTSSKCSCFLAPGLICFVWSSLNVTSFPWSFRAGIVFSLIHLVAFFWTSLLFFRGSYLHSMPSVGKGLALKCWGSHMFLTVGENLWRALFLSHLVTSCQQDYDAMVKLVETLEMLPTCDLADQHNIKFHYAFALNR